jgi:hypothetical protein
MIDVKKKKINIYKFYNYIINIKKESDKFGVDRYNEKDMSKESFLKTLKLEKVFEDLV